MVAIILPPNFDPSTIYQSAMDKENLIQLINKSKTNKENYMEWKRGLEVGKAQFWKVFQQEGDRVGYDYAFNNAYWDDSTFTPFYNIRGNLIQSFQDCRITDLSSILAMRNLKLDLQEATAIIAPFARSTITHLPELDLGDDCWAYGNKLCADMKNLEIVDLIRTHGDAGFCSIGEDAFVNCPNLKEVRFAGVISNSIYLADSPGLSKDSLTSLRKVLYDWSGGTPHYLRIGAINKAKFSASEIAEMESKGWVIE